MNSTTSKNILQTGVKRFSADHEITVSAKDKIGKQKPVMEVSDFNCEELRKMARETIAQDVDFRNKKPTSEKILQDEDHTWVIIDCQKILCEDLEYHLAILATTDSANLEQRKRLGGMIMNLEDRRVIFTDNRETIETTLDEISVGGNNIVNFDDQLSFDKPKISGTFEVPEKAAFKAVYNSVGINVFVEKGIMFFCTKKRIWTARSRFGGSRSFQVMYQEANGPTKEYLFGPGDYLYSSKLVNVEVVHQELLVSSKQIVKVPYIIFNGIYPINKQLLKGEEKLKVSVYNPKLSCPQVPLVVTESKMYAPFTLKSIAEANKLVKYGYAKKSQQGSVVSKKGAAETQNKPIGKEEGTLKEEVASLNGRPFASQSPLTGEAVVYNSPDGITYKIKSSAYTFGWNLRSSEFFIGTRFSTILENSSKLKNKMKPFVKDVKVPKETLNFYLKNSDQEDHDFIRECAKQIEDFKTKQLAHEACILKMPLKKYVSLLERRKIARPETYDNYAEKLNGHLILANFLFFSNPCHIPEIKNLFHNFLLGTEAFARRVLKYCDQSTSDNISRDFQSEKNERSNAVMRDYIQLLVTIEDINTPDSKIQAIYSFVEMMEPKERYRFMRLVTKHFDKLIEDESVMNQEDFPEME